MRVLRDRKSRRDLFQSRSRSNGVCSGNRWLVLWAVLGMGIGWAVSVFPIVAGVSEPLIEQFERIKRVTVYDADKVARYPSVVQTSGGELLVVFTRQSSFQQQRTVGDLVLSRSEDQGATWSTPEVVFSSQQGEPRAVGTMSLGSDGRVLLPFAIFSRGQITSSVHLLISDDQAGTWSLREVHAELPLSWWAPSGKVVQTADGTLLMPVYGASTPADLKATVHGCGLLRSSDHGDSWGDFSWIVQGRSRLVGAAGGSRFSFEGLSVVLESKFSGERMLAMVTARRLNESGTGPTETNAGPGASQVLCRMWSKDQGRSWSRPDQLLPGAWPSQTLIGSYAVCANVQWAAWGEVRLLVSRNLFRSFFQETRVTIRGWLQGMHNRPQETPAPPTVPYLADEWPFEHYGFSSLQPIDEENVMVVINRPQRGEGQIEGAANQKIPMERERIEAVFFRRTPVQGDIAPPVAVEPKRPSGRWVLVERMVVDDFGPTAQMPGGDLLGRNQGRVQRSSDGGRSWQPVAGATLPESLGAFGILRSGRWLASTQQVNEPWKDGQHQRMGTVGGYPTFKMSGESYDASIVVYHSDDEGKTWTAGKPFKGPFRWAIPTVSHFFESQSGDVVLPIFGCVSEDEMSSYSSSNGVIRSKDGTDWSDFSFVFRAEPPRAGQYQWEPRYSEMDILKMSDGTWVAFSRHEFITMGPSGWAANDVVISTDQGRRWKKTGGSLAGMSQQKGVVLPRGGLALTYRSSSWQQPGVVISYDQGRSFDYGLAGPYETVNAFATKEDEFVIFTTKGHRSDMLAGIYRWVPESGR